MFNISLHGPGGLLYSAGPSLSTPVAPDYAICDRRYGTRLTPLLCGRAADTLTLGDSPVEYTVHTGGPGPQSLPHTATFGE